MFILNYNPKIDDLFLYDDTNTGYPTGINPDHPLYGYKKYFLPIGVRSRAYSTYQKHPDYPNGPPAGTPIKQYPNYYNNNQVLSWWVGVTTLGSSVHYTPTKPSDSPSIPEFSKKTTQQDARTLKYWENLNFTTLEDYGPFYNIYTHVPGNLVRTTNITSRYFNGSPEVPGFESGATYYQISNKDYGFLTPVSQNYKNQTFLRTISLASIAKLKNIDIKLDTDYYLYNDFYLWDGQDRVIPVSLKVNFSAAFLTTFVYAFSDRIQKVWDGDSSGLLLYADGNEIFTIGHTLAFTQGADYIYVQCTLHSNETYPVFDYLVNKKLVGSNYICTKNTETVGASSGAITALNNSLSTAITTSNNKISQLIGISAGVIYDVYVDSIPLTDDAQIDQEYQSRYNALNVKEILFIYQFTQTSNGTNVVNYNFGSTNVNESALITYLTEQNVTSGDYVAFNFNEDEWDNSIMGLDPFDPTTTGNNDETLNGTLNTGVSNIVISATNVSKTNFPGVYFAMWGWPYVPNYFTNIYPTGSDQSFDWSSTTEEKKQDRIDFSVEQFKPVFNSFNWANPFCYDSVPKSESIDNELVSPNSIQDLSNGNNPYPFTSKSTANDGFRNAHITTVKNIATELGKTNFPIIPSISRFYAPGIYYSGFGRIVPNFEILDYVKNLKTAFPEITSVSIWASASYLLKTIACGPDLTLSSGSLYYTQQNIRDSITRLFYKGYSPVPSIYPSWNNSTLRSEVVQKYNDYTIELISNIKEFVK